jgi:hypothetical protein
MIIGGAMLAVMIVVGVGVLYGHAVRPLFKRPTR